MYERRMQRANETFSSFHEESSCMSQLPSLMALRCFDASARHGSFTLAASEVHLTQSAVSHQILTLEAQLGLPLFVRARNGLQLTAAGRAYWSEVAIALRQIERATQTLLMHQGAGGALNLCVASSFATYWLVPRLPGFVAAHPEVTLNLSTHIGPVDLSAAAHDAAIEYGAGPEDNVGGQGVLADPVMSLTLRPYASRQWWPRSHPPGPAALKALLTRAPLIQHSTVLEAWPKWLEAAGMDPHAINPQGPRYDLMSMALNAAIAGLGVALLPTYLTDGALARGQLVRLSDRAWTSAKAYHLRYPSWKADLAPLQRFRDWLMAASAEPNEAAT